MFAPDEGLRERALQVLQPLVDEMTAVDAWKRDVFGYRYGADGEAGESFLRDGLLRFELPAPVIDAINRAAAPLVARVKQRLDEIRAAGGMVHFGDQSEAVLEDAHPELWAGIDAAMKEIGAYDLTTHFFNAKGAKLKSATVLISQPGGEPAAMTAPPSDGLHIDSAGRCIIKAVLYLNDVGPEQGPFGMVPGSHRWEEGSVGRIYRRAFDRSPLVARGEKERRLFVSLPPEMQVKAEFGRDLLPEWPQTQALLEREAVSLGPRGLVSLFDPESIHRGGQASGGERQAILIVIRGRW